MSIWQEFFQDKNGKGSATRLNMITGVYIGSIIVLVSACMGKLSEGIFGIYMLATGGVYGLGKYRESVENVEKTRADSPNQPPDPLPVPPATVINVGQNKQTDAKDVNIAAAGDVKIAQKRKRK